MITNIARAFRWQALIDSGKFSNVHELARAIGKDDAYVLRIIRFTLLAPEIIHAVLAGKINKSISTEKLKQSLPTLWEDQKKMFNIEWQFFLCGTVGEILPPFLFPSFEKMGVRGILYRGYKDETRRKMCICLRSLLWCLSGISRWVPWLFVWFCPGCLQSVQKWF